MFALVSQCSKRYILLGSLLNKKMFHVATEWFLSGDYAFHKMFTALICIDLNTRGAGSYDKGAREATGYRCFVKRSCGGQREFLLGSAFVFAGA